MFITALPTIAKHGTSLGIRQQMSVLSYKEKWNLDICRTRDGVESLILSGLNQNQKDKSLRCKAWFSVYIEGCSMDSFGKSPSSVIWFINNRFLEVFPWFLYTDMISFFIEVSLNSLCVHMPVCLYLHYIHIVPAEARGGLPILRSWRKRRLWATLCKCLDLNPGPL